LKDLITKIYKYLDIQTFHTCAHHDNYIIKNFSYLCLAQNICYDLVSVPALNKL
jgi:hypothetical protein